MKSKALISVLLLSLLSVTLFSQTKTDTLNKRNHVKPKYALGLCAGYNVGYGEAPSFENALSFKYAPNNFGIQTTFFPYYDEASTQLYAGLNLLYNLIIVERTTFYLYQGNQLCYYQNRKPLMCDNDKKTIRFNHGAGLGLGIIILKRISLNLMFGYALYDNFAELHRKGELGLYYKF